MVRGFACLIVVLLATSAGAQQQHRQPQQPKRDMLAVQVLVDRAGFSPGEIDGNGGTNTDRAVDAYERVTGSQVGDLVVAAKEPPTTKYTITAEDAAVPLVRSIPRDMEAKAGLKRLNPRLRLGAGQQIVVPNVIVVPDAEGKPQPDAVVHVSKSSSTLWVTDGTGKTIMHAPVTSGSEHDPLPIGMWSVTAVSRNPSFNYNPDLFWDADPSHMKAKIPPGPNNPVGVVWIDLSKEHYGIHGTPEPSTIGHSESHGCVRLTNWDALRLAAMVGKGTKVEFVE